MHHRIACGAVAPPQRGSRSQPRIIPVEDYGWAPRQGREDGSGGGTEQATQDGRLSHQSVGLGVRSVTTRLVFTRHSQNRSHVNATPVMRMQSPHSRVIGRHRICCV